MKRILCQPAGLVLVAGSDSHTSHSVDHGRHWVYQQRLVCSIEHYSVVTFNEVTDSELFRFLILVKRIKI